jgi:ribosomal-protein-alanine N-acetyltransferase
MNFYIETPRLILRDFKAEDTEGLFRLDSDPLVHKFLGNQPIEKMEEAKQVVNFVREQYESNGIGRWATIEKESGAFIGWSGLKYIREEENGHRNFYDVGYRLIPEFWGKGYATEACKASLDFGFNNFDMDKIVGTANELNLASIRVLSKCGLVYKNQFMWKDIRCNWMEVSREEHTKQST